MSSSPEPKNDFYVEVSTDEFAYDPERIRAGQKAWPVIKRHQQEDVRRQGRDWVRWEAICIALAIGRREVLRQIASERNCGLHDISLQGQPYTGRYSQWLQEHELHDIPATTRKAALDCAPHLAEIRLHLAAVLKTDPDEYSSLRAPQKVWASFQASIHKPEAMAQNDSNGGSADEAALRVTAEGRVHQLEPGPGAMPGEATEPVKQDSESRLVAMTNERDVAVQQLNDVLAGLAAAKQQMDPATGDEPDEVPAGKRHWLTPPADYAKLNEEFHFDFDPCPYPRPEGFDGLAIRWGRRNFVNPPFRSRDGSPTAFADKAIEELALHGNESVLLLPVASYVMKLIEAGAEVRSMGRIKWLEVETREPYPSPSPVCAFILRRRGSDHAGVAGALAT